MTVATHPAPHCLTWEAFLELPEVMRPGPVDVEWGEGDTIETPVLPGFTADVATVLASAR